MTTPPDSSEVKVALGLGANLGDRLAALQRGIDVITQDPGVEGLAVSAVFETDPVGGPQQPDYLNAVLVIRTALVPVEVLALAHLAEQELHRTREVRWGARTLDVDVINYGDIVNADPALTLPHPRASERAFVLIPLIDADRTLQLAGAPKSTEQLLADLPAADIEGVRRRDDLELNLGRHAGG